MSIQTLLSKRAAAAIPHLDATQQLELIVSLDRLDLLDGKLPFSVSPSHLCSTSLYCRAFGSLLQVRQKERLTDILAECWRRDDVVEEDKMHLFCGLSCYQSDWDFERFPLSFFCTGGDLSLLACAYGLKALRQLPPSKAEPYIPTLVVKAKMYLDGRIPMDVRNSLLLSCAMCGEELPDMARDCDDERVRFFNGLSVGEQRTHTLASRDLCSKLGEKSGEYAPLGLGPYCIDAHGPDGSFVLTCPKDYTHGELSYETRSKMRQFERIAPVTLIPYSEWRNWRRS